MKRERWQTKSDGKGASAAEAKWILRAKRVKDERGFVFKNVANVHIGSVTNLYRLDFHFIPSSHFPQRGKQGMDLPVPSGEPAPKGKARKVRKFRLTLALRQI